MEDNMDPNSVSHHDANATDADAAKISTETADATSSGETAVLENAQSVDLSDLIASMQKRWFNPGRALDSALRMPAQAKRGSTYQASPYSSDVLAKKRRKRLMSKAARRVA